MLHTLQLGSGFITQQPQSAALCQRKAACWGNLSNPLGIALIGRTLLLSKRSSLHLIRVLLDQRETWALCRY